MADQIRVTDRTVFLDGAEALSDEERRDIQLSPERTPAESCCAASPSGAYLCVREDSHGGRCVASTVTEVIVVWQRVLQ